MKRWILVPCLMMGNALVYGYSGLAEQPQASSTVQAASLSVESETNALSSLTQNQTSETLRKVDPQYPFGHFAEKMSCLVFAAIIKYQFPGHDNLDSMALAKRALAAYPVYEKLVECK